MMMIRMMLVLMTAAVTVAGVADHTTPGGYKVRAEIKIERIRTR